MIINGSIVSYQLVSGVSKTGVASYASAVTVNVPCALQGPTFMQQSEIDKRKLSADTVIHVELSELPSNWRPKDGDLVNCVVGESPAVVYEVQWFRDWQHTFQSHFEIYARAK